MNPSSAADYIGIFLCMIAGHRYERTHNVFATDYYLSHIHKDYGVDGLRKALSSLSLHLEYYEGLRQTTLKKIRSIHEKYTALLDLDSHTIFPDEVPDAPALVEGCVTKVTVNVFERNPIARQKCIDHYGCKCFVCKFDFEAKYGGLGWSFIHVHHLIQLSTIKKEYQVDPINDLRPLCPNCHAMIHRRIPALSIDELQGHISSQLPL
jgi:5-methylcytosine-specific restriction protein A